VSGENLWALQGRDTLVYWSMRFTRYLKNTASLLWLWKVDGRAPDIYDVAGVALSVAGALVILLGRHAAA